MKKHAYLYVKDIVAYVMATFKVSYTVPGMRSWLQRQGFSYKKTAVVPGKANKEQQEAWLAEYENLNRDFLSMKLSVSLMEFILHTTSTALESELESDRTIMEMAKREGNLKYVL